MEKRTKTQIVAESIGEAVKEEAAGIVEIIPGVGKVASKMIVVAQKASEKTNEKLRGMEKDTEKPPRFMQSVKFCCKKNQIISDQQRSEIELILQNCYESMEKESLEDIEYFIDTYVGRDMDTGGIVDYTIGEDFLWIRLFDCEQFLYDEECLQKTLNALNTLLREEVFECCEAWGHDEDYRYD